MTSSSGITEQAKAWSAYVATNVKTQPIDSNSYFLVGRTLLDKVGFNSINDGEHDAVHGVAVVYGPFPTKAEMNDFVASYNVEMWPGDNEWTYVQPGKPFILSSFTDPNDATVVHNKSLDFQGQLGYNVMQERIKEVEEVQKRLNAKAPEKMTKDELDLHLKWQEERVRDAEVAVVKMKKHLETLRNERNKDMST